MNWNADDADLADSRGSDLLYTKRIRPPIKNKIAPKYSYLSP